MSHLKRDRLRKRLTKLLEMADPESFMRLVWAVDALQSGREDCVSYPLNYPKEAVTTDFSSTYMVHKWNLETLVNELLATERRPLPRGRYRLLNCQEFSAIAEATNLLRSLEEAEAGIFLKRMSVLNELPRIAHQQFGWQRGYANVINLYRSKYIYGGKESSAYFKETSEITLDEFMLVGFAIYSHFSSHDSMPSTYGMTDVGISNFVRDQAIKRICLPYEEAAVETRVIRRPSALPVAYQPSQLRKSPGVEFGHRATTIRVPLVELLMWRITQGVYYDIVPGGSKIHNEIGERFHAYSRELLSSTIESMELATELRYSYRGKNFASPDLTLHRGSQLLAVFECKAKKMSIEARFSESPVRDAASGFAEIAKGVLQIWRFWSHLRSGALNNLELGDCPVGVVLTLEPWLVAAVTNTDQVLSAASEMAANEGITVSQQDRDAIIFCPIDALEETLLGTDESGFLKTLRSATEPKYTGWILPNISTEVAAPRVLRKYRFANRVGEVLPWWDELEARAKAQQASDGS